MTNINIHFVSWLILQHATRYWFYVTSTHLPQVLVLRHLYLLTSDDADGDQLRVSVLPCGQRRPAYHDGSNSTASAVRPLPGINQYCNSTVFKVIFNNIPFMLASSLRLYTKERIRNKMPFIACRNLKYFRFSEFQTKWVKDIYICLVSFFLLLPSIAPRFLTAF